MSDQKTLRDEFAIEALKALWMHDYGSFDTKYDEFAEMAYKFADAMIKARNPGCE